MAAARQTRGRQRIPIRLIQNQDDLYASFSKRRLGLFKKASELSTLCGADVGVIVFSPTDNPFSFFSPTMDSIVDRYLTPDCPPRQAARAIDAHARSRVQTLNKRLDDLLHQKLHLKDYSHQLDLADRAREKAWWEETPVEGLDKEQVREWTVWFRNLKARVEDKVAELRNGGSSSSASVQGFVAAATAAPSSYYGADQFSPPLFRHRNGGSSSSASVQGFVAAATAAPSSYYGADQFAPPLNFFNSPPMDSFYRHITNVGTGGGHVISSQYHRYYVGGEGGDAFAAGNSGGGSGGGSVFPAAAYVDQPGGLMPPSHSSIVPSTNLCFTPNYLTASSGVQTPPVAASEEEAAASNQGGN